MGSQQSRAAGTNNEKPAQTTSEKAYQKTRYVVLGSVGSGKSSFINAIRGLKDDDEHAAKVGVFQTTMTSTEYRDLTNPLVTFCDLPGYDPQNHHDVATYWNRFELENYDRFLVITSVNLTDFHMALCEKVKAIDKPFFIIRTKIDLDFTAAEEGEEFDFDEERELAKIKDSLMERAKHLPVNEENVFLISHRVQEKGDLTRLHQAVYNLPAVPEVISDVTEEYMSDVKEHIEKHGVSRIEEFLRKKLERSKNVKIKFAITGNTGVGKSTFINAIRGLNDNDEGAAKVDFTEVRIEPTEYQHPDNHLISFWDLPGIGGPKFSNFDKYCKEVKLTTYDTFLIFTATRFTENDLKFAEKVKSIGKSFFLIRTKIDVDCMPKPGKAPINEEEILQRIREDIVKNVKNLVSSEKDIFLIGNYDKGKWDFDRLIVAISDALPMVQRECLTLSLTNITRDHLKRKAKFLKAKAVATAALSGAAGLIPVPGVSPVVDIVLVGASITWYYKVFGLHKITSEELNSLQNKKIRQLFERYQFSSTGELVTITSMPTLMAMDGVPKFIPIVGAAIAGCAFFGTTLYYLNKSINELEEVALAFWDNAAKRSNQNDLWASTND